MSEKRRAAERRLTIEETEMHEPAVKELEKKRTREEEEDEEDLNTAHPKSLKDRVPWLAGNMRSNLDRKQKEKKTRRAGVAKKGSRS